MPAFYIPPDPLPVGQSGDIVRSESISVEGGLGWRILYRSIGVDGVPVAVSGLLIQPSGEAPAGGWPVIAWAHGTSGSADACAPSLQGPQGIPVLKALLSAGYVVVATDYEGLGTPGPHPYLIGPSEGRAVLDSLRAARSLIPAAVGPSLIWGYSQGGQAALWAGEMAASYADELPIAGVAAFAPAARVAPIFEQMPSSKYAGLFVAALEGLSVAHPDLDLTEVLTSSALERTYLLESECADAVDAVFSRLASGAIRTSPESLPSWRAAIAANEAGDTRSYIPVIVVYGSDDILTQLGIVDLYVEHACTAGTSVEQRRYPGVDHDGIVVVAAQDVLLWSEDRITARPIDSKC